MRITSVQNKKVKEYVKLIKQKKARQSMQSFIVEGAHLVEEAIREGVALEVLVLEGQTISYDVPTIEVTEEVMRKISDTKSPQGVIAKCRMIEPAHNHFERILLLDDVNDPGNLGTILRSADAFGFDVVYLSDQTVDLYNPKVIRATQGAIFRVPTIRASLKTIIPELKQLGVKVFAADLGGIPLHKLSSQEKMAFVMGNEANGVSIEILNLVDESLTIEMTGASESLNVSVAASIIMYNFRK